jgi:hypothetical protein
VLAACALVVLPPSGSVAAPAARDVRARVESVRTTSVHGLFRSEVELRTTSCASNDNECPAALHAVVWGGSLGGVRQIVGGVDTPREGERVRVVLEGATSHDVASLVRDVAEGEGR